MKQEDIKKRIVEIKPFFEQLTFFFLALIAFIIITSFFPIPKFLNYTIIVLFTGFALALILQELYVYKTFMPVLLNNKRWEEMARKSLKKRR